MLCLCCERIMQIRLKQRKGFMFDLCPECRARVKAAFKIKMAKTG